MCSLVYGFYFCLFEIYQCYVRSKKVQQSLTTTDSLNVALDFLPKAECKSLLLKLPCTLTQNLEVTRFFTLVQLLILLCASCMQMKWDVSASSLPSAPSPSPWLLPLLELWAKVNSSPVRCFLVVVVVWTNFNHFWSKITNTIPFLLCMFINKCIWINMCIC